MVERGTALLRKMEINVAEAEKRNGKNTVNMQETYTVYLIETRWVRKDLYSMFQVPCMPTSTTTSHLLKPSIGLYLICYTVVGTFAHFPKWAK